MVSCRSFFQIMQDASKYRATIFFVAKQNSKNVVAFLPFQWLGSGKRRRRFHIPFIHESGESITTELINRISKAEWDVTGKTMPTSHPDLFIFEVKSGYPSLPLGENGGVELANRDHFIDIMHKIADQLSHGAGAAEEVQRVMDEICREVAA